MQAKKNLYDILCIVYVYTYIPKKLIKLDMSFKRCGQKIDCTQFLYKMATGSHLGFRTEPKTTRSRDDGTVITNIIIWDLS